MAGIEKSIEELFYLSAAALSTLIKKKKVTCVEVMQAYLKRIDRVQPVINAYTQRVDPDECMQAAKEADRRIAKGMPIGKLHGIPCAIKDILNVEGLVVSAGCEELFKKGKKASQDAPLVSRLKSEGAIVLGLTNVPELCRGGNADNLVYGRTNNPYDLARTSGGSSGGSAASLAAGMSAIALGSDGGGSLTQPSHCNGTVCLKPTHGRSPNTGTATGDALGLLTPFIQYGPMARFVEDLELLFPIIQGPDGKDPHAIPVPIGLPDPMKNLRIAYYLDDGISPPTKEIQKLVKDAALSLKDAVASVEENKPLVIGKTFQLHWSTFLGGDRGEEMKNYLKTLGDFPYSWELQEFLSQAKEVEYPTSFLLDRLVAIDEYRMSMLSFMQNHDIILCPPFPVPAKRHGIGLREISDFSYPMAFNLTGWPTVVVRCGTSQEGLPLGVLVAARPWKDATALLVAKQLESNFGGWKPSALSELQ